MIEERYKNYPSPVMSSPSHIRMGVEKLLIAIIVFLSQCFLAYNWTSKRLNGAFYFISRY